MVNIETEEDGCMCTGMVRGIECERLFDHKLLNKDQIMLVKQYYKHVDHPDFSREIYYVSNS